MCILGQPRGCKCCSCLFRDGNHSAHTQQTHATNTMVPAWTSRMSTQHRRVTRSQGASSHLDGDPIGRHRCQPPHCPRTLPGQARCRPPRTPGTGPCNRASSPCSTLLWSLSVQDTYPGQQESLIAWSCGASGSSFTIHCLPCDVQPVPSNIQKDAAKRLYNFPHQEQVWHAGGFRTWRRRGPAGRRCAQA